MAGLIAGPLYGVTAPWLSVSLPARLTSHTVRTSCNWAVTATDAFACQRLEERLVRLAVDMCILPDAMPADAWREPEEQAKLGHGCISSRKSGPACVFALTG